MNPEIAAWLNRAGLMFDLLAFFFATPELIGEARLRRFEAKLREALYSVNKSLFDVPTVPDELFPTEKLYGGNTDTPMFYVIMALSLAIVCPIAIGIAILLLRLLSSASKNHPLEGIVLCTVAFFVWSFVVFLATNISKGLIFRSFALISRFLQNRVKTST